MMKFYKETSPHIRRHSSVYRMMLDVIIALLPVVILSIFAYGWHAVMVLGISIFTMLAAEFVYVGLRNKMVNDGEKHTFKEKFQYAYKGHYTWANVLAPLVSALIFTMIMPSGTSWYEALVGSLIGIVFGKLVFGGLGNNIFNPAAVGMIVAKLCFGSNFINSWWITDDVVTSGTPLGNLSNGLSTTLENYSFLDLFLGRIGGTFGEVFVIFIILGAIYLIVRKSADYRPMCAYLASFTALIIVAGLVIKFACHTNIRLTKFIAYEVLTGGVLFGAVFMVTDPVTSPITSPGRVMYGVIAGVLTVFIRFFAALPEGVGFSILIANMFVPVIEYYKWSGQEYTKKKMLVIGLLFVIPMIIMILALIGKKGGFWYV